MFNFFKKKEVKKKTPTLQMSDSDIDWEDSINLKCYHCQTELIGSVSNLHTQPCPFCGKPLDPLRAIQK